MKELTLKTDLQTKQSSGLSILVNNHFGNSLAVLNLFLVALHYTGIIRWVDLPILISITTVINFPSYLMADALSEIFLMIFSPDGKMIQSYFTFYLLVSSVCIYFQWNLIGHIIEKKRKSIK